MKNKLHFKAQGNVKFFHNHHDDHENELPHGLPLPEASLSENTTAAAETAINLADTFSLHSNPGANHTIYLDFNGHTTSGTHWNRKYNNGANIVTPAYDFDDDASSFSDQELQRIQYIWQRVAEDFIPFDVNVTTEDPGVAALIKSGGGDRQWGIRVAIGGIYTDWLKRRANGTAFLHSFNRGSDTPTYVFAKQLANGYEKYTADVISHEVGHTLGLGHDGINTAVYYDGHNHKTTSWGPIMGHVLTKNLTQWSKGEYSGANNKQDDLAIITSRNGFGYRPDDHGNRFTLATELDVAGTAVSGSGIIEQNTDIDYFSFTTGAGTVSFDILPAERGPNLDILATLYDSQGSFLASSNPTEDLSASFDLTLTSGKYFLSVTGTGFGDPRNEGYSDYGSLGSYSISGSIVTPSNEQEIMRISATDAVKAEGSLGSTSFTFTVTRSGNTSNATTVAYNLSGSGTNPATSDDFSSRQLPRGTVNFASGQTSATITVEVNGDTRVEEDEAFRVVLSPLTNVTPSTTVISVDTAEGLIQNDDVIDEPAALSLTIDSASISENGGTSIATVSRNTNTSGDLTVNLRSSDTSEATVPSTVTIPNGQSSVTFDVTGVDEGEADGDIRVTITARANGFSDGVDEVMVRDDENPSQPLLYFSLKGNGQVGNISYADEDIISFDGNNFATYFDGSDVGLSHLDIDAFDLIESNQILLSFTSSATINGISVDDSDVVRFTATQLGPTTAGTFEMYFDASDVGLSSSRENVDALARLANGDLLVSTNSKFSVPGASGEEEDLLRFTPTSLGSNTSGSWSLYFDGSDVGLGNSSREDVDALAVDGSSEQIYLSTVSYFSVSGVSGANEDVFTFTPSSLGNNTSGTYGSQLFFDGSNYGIRGDDISAIDI